MVYCIYYNVIKHSVDRQSSLVTFENVHSDHSTIRILQAEQAECLGA